MAGNKFNRGYAIESKIFSLLSHDESDVATSGLSKTISGTVIEILRNALTITSWPTFQSPNQPPETVNGYMVQLIAGKTLAHE